MRHRVVGERSVPHAVARHLGWDGTGCPGEYLSTWVPASDVEHPHEQVARASVPPCARWLAPAFFGRGPADVVVLFIGVRQVEPLAGVLSWQVNLVDRGDVQGIGQDLAAEILPSLDLASRAGQYPLLVIFHAGKMAKAIMLGLSPREVARG